MDEGVIVGFKPSSLDVYISSLPPFYQKLAMNAIAEEHQRLERGEYTEEEYRYYSAIQIASAKLANNIDSLILKSLEGYYGNGF